MHKYGLECKIIKHFVSASIYGVCPWYESSERMKAKKHKMYQISYQIIINQKDTGDNRIYLTTTGGQQLP